MSRARVFTFLWGRPSPIVFWGSESASLTFTRKRSRSAGVIALHSASVGPTGSTAAGDAGTTDLVVILRAYSFGFRRARRALGP